MEPLIQYTQLNSAPTNKMLLSYCFSPPDSSQLLSNGSTTRSTPVPSYHHTLSGLTDLPNFIGGINSSALTSSGAFISQSGQDITRTLSWCSLNILPCCIPNEYEPIGKTLLSYNHHKPKVQTLFSVTLFLSVFPPPTLAERALFSFLHTRPTLSLPHNTS